MSTLNDNSSEIIIWGLTLKEIVFTVASVLGVGAMLRIFLKQHFESKFEMYTKGQRLLENELHNLKSPMWKLWLERHTAEKQESLRLSYALHCELEQIKTNDLGKKYRFALDKMLRVIAKVLKEKVHIGTATTKNESWFGENLFTVKSYEFCLVLAFFYPVFFAILSWLFSSELTVAGMSFSEYQPLHIRLMTILALGIGIYAFFKASQIKIAENKTQRNVVKKTILVLFGIGALSITLSGAYIGAFSGGDSFVSAGALSAGGFLAAAITFGMSVVTAVGITFIFVFIFPGAGTGTFLLSVAGASLIMLMWRFRHKVKANYYWVVFNIFTLTFSLILIMAITHSARDSHVKIALLLFFCVFFPLINAVVDWISLNITRGLLIRIRQNHAQPLEGLVLAIVDIVLAVSFVFAVTGLLVTVMICVNRLGYEFSGKVLLDLKPLMRDLLIPDKVWQTLWVHGMIFSTIVPTALHLVYAVSAVVLMPKIRWRNENIDNFWKDRRAQVSLYYYSVFSWWATLGVAILVLLILVFFAYNFGKPITLALWHWADYLLQFDVNYIPV